MDCSSLTQAGYIGTDIESSIERLLLAASHSIQKCETGIIFFDEVDKLAKPAVMTHGRDVSGEGVQQGLLKMIEGTTVTVNAKADRSSKTESQGRGDRVERGRDGGASAQQAGKSEQFTVDTTNILFVFAGAFVGLEKIISSRLSSGSSLGFGAQLKHTPISRSPSTKSSQNSQPKTCKPKPTTAPNVLKHVLPSDLQTYGLIPELLGRIPILTSLAPLSLSQLTLILTSPRNSLVAQYTALFLTYNITLKFTTRSLHAIASQALHPASSISSAKPGTASEKGGGGGSGIGARGLRGIMESLLSEIMFRGPGSAIRFCLVDEAFVKEHFSPSSSSPSSSGEEEDGDEDDGRKESMPRCWSRGQNNAFEEAYEREEEEWRRTEGIDDDAGKGEEGEGGNGGFEKFRQVGSSGM